VEAAIAAGVILPEQADALRRRGPAIGEKPKLYEVHIEGGYKEGYEPSSSSPPPPMMLDDQEVWSNITPVSATIIPGNRSRNGSHTSSAPVSNTPYSTAANGRNQRSWFRHWPEPATTILPMTTSPPSLPLPTTTIPDGIPPPLPPPPPPPAHMSNSSNGDVLQLTVLIAMPTANPQGRNSTTGFYSRSKESSGDEEEEIPQVVFGTTEVGWDAGADWKPDEARDTNEPRR